MVVGRELVQCKLAFAALAEQRRYSFEVEEARELDRPLEQVVPVQEEQRSLPPKDPAVAVAEEVEKEEPCSVRLRHWALLGQAQRLQMDPDCSPASPARR